MLIDLLILSQPEDWDEDAPYEILDEDAAQPEGWLVQEPLTIPDPGKQAIKISLGSHDFIMQTLPSLRSGTTLKTVIGLLLQFPIPNALKHLDAVNGSGKSIHELQCQLHLSSQIVHSSAILPSRASGLLQRSQIPPTKVSGRLERFQTPTITRILLPYSHFLRL